MNRSKLISLTSVALVLLFHAVSLHAQNGCTDSPEAPTDVLLAVGAIGLTRGSAIVSWFRRGR
jgi:XrtJ-associated TM-motif-TM protein